MEARCQKGKRERAVEMQEELGSIGGRRRGRGLYWSVCRAGAVSLMTTAYSLCPRRVELMAKFRAERREESAPRLTPCR